MSNKNDIGDHKCSAGDFGIVISKGERVSSEPSVIDKKGGIKWSEK